MLLALVEKMKLWTMPKVAIARTLSMLVEAMATVGIPLSVPRCCSWNCSIMGMTTAAEAADMTNLFNPNLVYEMTFQAPSMQVPSEKAPKPRHS